VQRDQSEAKWMGWLEWFGLLVIMAIATYLRYWRLAEVPPGFNSDEAVGAMGALTTLREGFKYSYDGQGGGGVLGFYFAAAAFYLFGPSIASIRGLAAWASLVGLLAHYWAVREMFRPGPAAISREQLPLSHRNRARLLASLSTLGLALSVWHLQLSRVAFAGIGVPFLLLPSIYFLWRGLNQEPAQPARRWPFIVSGLLLGSLLYIYLSGAFAPPLYVAFFIGQWLLIWLSKRFGSERWPQPIPPTPYLTRQFRPIFVTALAASLVILPIVTVVLTSPGDEPGVTRVSQASFLNPNINQGDPWGLLGRSIAGNFSAYGISPAWLIGQLPPRLTLPPALGLLVFAGFLLACWRALRGQAAYLFTVLWFVMLLLPSILAPDAIPHTLRAVGATNPTYIFAAIAILGLFEFAWAGGQRWLRPRLAGPTFRALAGATGLVLATGLTLILWSGVSSRLYHYFYVFPTTNDAKAAYHVYAVEMAEEINRETRPEVAFILPRNTAAGDIFRNFTTDFLVALAQPAAAHFWVVDDETSLANDLTAAAAQHHLIRVVRWKTSKHTGADPKAIIPYYLEKYGHFVEPARFEYFDIDTFQLDSPAPDFAAQESLPPASANFNQQLQLTGYAFGSASNPAEVATPQANSNDLMWLRLRWQKLGPHPENLKVSALLYAGNGQLVTQLDKLLLSNIRQVGSAQWELGAQEDTYFLIPIPPATPPGRYQLQLAVYGADSLARLPLLQPAPDAIGGTLALGQITVLPALTPVDPASLSLALPVSQEILPGLIFLGFETLPGQSLTAGAEVWASVLWQAGQPPLKTDWLMALLAQPPDRSDPVVLAQPTGLAGSGYPTSQWQPGQILRGWLKARIAPALTPGTYELKLQLTGPAQPNAEALLLPIGHFQVQGWERNFDRPSPQIEMGASFNGQALLVGLDASANQVAPGQALQARLYWQAKAEFDQNYTAFVHLIGPDGRLYGQLDHIPGNGAFPTTGWLTGEYLVDDYSISLSPEAPPGDYQLAIGLYNSATGQRLTLSNDDCGPVSCQKGDDAVRLSGLVVR
jgi:hypothetical protein